MTAPASTADPLRQNLAGKRLGRYEVLTQLASGGMAAVYIARAVGVAGFERLVAIKVLHPHLAHEEEFATMFLDEARLAARIRHPNVVATLDISDTEGDGYFLVMDYIEGDHLGALLQRAAKQAERLPPPVVCRIVIDALTGLGAAHQLTDERGEPLMLVHRDVSPHNVMVGVDGIARLTDFGVAKAEVRLSSTREGQFKGKLAYMAPEQASTGHADQRSDLFSMGIILWESLTGRRLFRGENNAETLNKILRAPIPTVSSQVPELAPFDAVTSKALARDLEERFQTADEFAEAVEEAAAQVKGVGTGRTVAGVVKKYAGDKLEAESSRLQEAIDYLGRTDIGEAHMPIPREGSASAVSMNRRLEPDAETQAARPGTIAGQQQLQQGKKKRVGLLVGIAAVAVLAAVGAAVALTTSSEPAAEQAPPGPTATAPGESEAETEQPATAADEAAAQPSEDGDDEAAEDEEPTAAEQGADDEPAETGEEPATDQAAARAEAERERRERLRRLRRQRRQQASDPEPEPSKDQQQGSSGGSDDDFIMNPYRR